MADAQIAQVPAEEGQHKATPSLANRLTRLVTGEGWRDLYLRPRFKRCWWFWATAWWGTPTLVRLGAELFSAFVSA